jgi:hypothetical protein
MRYKKALINLMYAELADNEIYLLKIAQAQTDTEVAELVESRATALFTSWKRRFLQD